MAHRHCWSPNVPNLPYLFSTGFARRVESDGPGAPVRRFRGHGLQAARKPDSVLDDHSSRRRVTAALQQPTRRFRLSVASLRLYKVSPPGRIGPIRSRPLESAGAIPAYLVLLRVGFTMRRPLLAARCALTAPFHPYPRRLAWIACASQPFDGGIFSVALAVFAP